MSNKIAASGYVSLDHIINIKNPIKVSYTSIVTNKDNREIKPGGCPINIAAALSKLGEKTSPFVRVGSDYESSGFKQFLLDNNVDTSQVKEYKDETTSTSYMLTDNNGDQVTVFYPGAMDEKYYSKELYSNIKEYDYAIVTVGPKLDNQEFVKQCIENNIPIIFGMKGDMQSFSKKFLKDIFTHSKVIFTNQAERKEIEKIFKLNSITELLSDTLEVIITTRGKQGSSYYYLENDKVIEGNVAAYDLFKRIDPTGCGDAYISGFIFGYLNGYGIKESCLLGSLLSSYVLSASGCCTRLPSKNELLLAYERYKGDL